MSDGLTNTGQWRHAGDPAAAPALTMARIGEYRPLSNALRRVRALSLCGI
jgi:hypothetical protein